MTSLQAETTFTGTLPDIPRNTRFIGVCGITMDEAAPDDDGWFFSDFFLLNHLFKGLGRSREWHTSADPAKLLELHGQYLHGNPFHPRRVVLDKGVEPERVIVHPERELLAEFLVNLEMLCSEASDSGDPVFLMVLGHGDEDTHGVEIGPIIGYDKDVPVYKRFEMDDLKRILERFPKLQISALFTSCFSGPWTTYINMTTMTAAGQKTESVSWTQSSSVKRLCGSIYTSALTDVMMRSENSSPPEGEIIYRTFTNNIQARLLRIDKFGDKQELAFSAQDSQWNLEYHNRTGIPRFHFQERLEKLPVFASVSVGYSDRTTDELLKEWGKSPMEGPSKSELHKTLLSKVRGSKKSLLRIMQSRAREYAQSFPGDTTMANNTRIGVLVARCLESTATEDELEKLSPCLSYRLRAGKLAGLILQSMDLEPFPAFHKWGFFEHAPYKDISDDLLDLILKARLVPKPKKDEGRPWSKPWQYLAAACHAKNLSLAQVEQRIAAAQAMKETDFMARQRNTEMEIRGRKTEGWFTTIHESVKRRARSLSPRKKLKYRSQHRISLGVEV